MCSHLWVLTKTMWQCDLEINSFYCHKLWLLPIFLQANFSKITWLLCLWRSKHVMPTGKLQTALLITTHAWRVFLPSLLCFFHHHYLFVLIYWAGFFTLFTLLLSSDQNCKNHELDWWMTCCLQNYNSKEEQCKQYTWYRTYTEMGRVHLTSLWVHSRNSRIRALILCKVTHSRFITAMDTLIVWSSFDVSH